MHDGIEQSFADGVLRIIAPVDPVKAGELRGNRELPIRSRAEKNGIFPMGGGGPDIRWIPLPPSGNLLSGC
jgi:hypothetical protein